MENSFYPFTNLPLPYDYDSLEPFIDEKTMRLHHDRHLQTYIDNLNAILTNCPYLQRLSLNMILKNSSIFPYTQKNAILNNAGGIFNHRFFFDMMTPSSPKEPSGNLLAAIDACFGGFKQFKERFKKAALSVFGSGYAWLVLDRGRLKIITTPNQNTPIALGVCPVLCIDVWEHAYYLKHYNLRADYIDDWFSVINWPKADHIFTNQNKKIS